MKFSYLSALVPRWIFFDAFEGSVEIFIRDGHSPDTWGPWRPGFTPPPRAIWQLIHNPLGNFRLYAFSCFERLITIAQAHVDHPGAVAARPEYRVCLELAKLESLADCPFIQFKIAESTETVFVSQVHGK